MNITISKRAKSYNQLGTNHIPIINHQQPLSKRPQRSLSRQNNLIEVSRQQQTNCTKWLFQKCLKKPSNVEELGLEQSISLKKTNAIHKLTCRRATQNVLRIERQPKINLVCNNKRIIKQQDCHIKIVSSQWLTRQMDSKQKQSSTIYINEKTNAHLDTKPYGGYASYTTSHQTSKEKIMPTNGQFSLRPSTFISYSNSIYREKTPNKSKLALSNNFITLMPTDLKPFKYHQQSVPFEGFSKAILEEVGSDNLSRFQLINPSQNELKVNEADGSNESINTSYIRKKIQFSSDFQEKIKYENCIYEPIYVSNQQDQSTSKKSHKNYHSQLIKVVNVDDQNYFNSAKSNQQESVVLEKGLDQIFNGSPTFKRLTQQRRHEMAIQEVINGEEDEHLKNIFNDYDYSDEILQISN